MTFPKNPSRVHLFQVEDRKFAFDVNNCIFTEVDNLAWDTLSASTRCSSESELLSEIEQRYEKKAALEAIEELKVLEEGGYLFSDDPLKNYKARLSPVTTLCLNIAQTCDLACHYCFADGGSYGESGNMSHNIAKRAIDFLINNSGGSKKLTICFFGGEPLLNLKVVKSTIKYCKEKEKEFGLEFQYNITTNGTRLTQSVREFLSTNKVSIIFSIDGPPEIHNVSRPFKDGSGSYDKISKNLKELISFSAENNIDFSIRATYTRKQHDISKVASHLVDLGCHDISVEPAVLRDDELEIRTQDLPEIKETYSSFARSYIEEIRKGRIFSFFHFRHTMDQTHRATRNLTQCGAGTGYLAVSADGKIYPCHRFVGREEYVMGDVSEGILKQDIGEMFSSNHVNAKSKCLDCWARYICGGGCHAYAIEYNNDISVPYDIECELMKHRIELGAYIYAELEDNYSNMLKEFYDASSRSRPYLSQN